MKRMNWMLIGLLAFAAACGDAEPTKTSANLPDEISVDGKGDWRTAGFTDFRASIRIDDSYSDTYNPAGNKIYQGYEVAFEEGDIVDIRVTGVSRGFDAVAGLYGPKKPSGAYGNLIAANDDSPEGGTYDSFIHFEVKKTGTYLVIVRDYSFNQGDFTLSIGCAGGTCESSQCRAVVCDLFCENGYQTDYEGCDMCQCNPEPSCQWTNPAPYVRCAGIQTFGKNPVDGTCCEYPSPCNVPGGYEQFATESACNGLGEVGDGCSMYGSACADGLECDYACPDGSNDPNCNLGINPTGTCVAAVATCSMYGGNSCEAGFECQYQCPDGSNNPNCNLGINPTGICVELPRGRDCQQDSDCIISGCSGQVCTNHNVITTCDYRPEYACYNPQNTSCGCTQGFCGWESTDALTACLGGN